MAHQRIPLELAPGLDPLDTSYATKGRFRDSANVRFWQGKPQVIGGWERVVPTPVPGLCRGLLGYTDEQGNVVVGVGTHSNLQVIVGGQAVDITPTDYVAGATDGTGGSGFGTGGFGVGGFGQPSLTGYYPASWSLADWAASSMMASPRGGEIYWWQADPTKPAAVLSGSPGQVSFMLVTPQVTVMALGCQEAFQSDGKTTPGPFEAMCIRESDAIGPTTWIPSSTNVASQTILDGSGRLIAGAVMGLDTVFAWTDSELYQGVWTGDPSQPRAWSLVAAGCGLIGPHAFVVAGQSAFWMDPTGQCWSCALSSVPVPILSPLQADMIANLAPGQADKVWASRCTEFQEVRWDYPDARDGAPNLENSRSVVVSLLSLGGETAPVWWRYRQPRTAMVDAGPAPNPIGVDPSGNVFYHELNASADGAAFDAYFETAAQFFDAAQTRMRVDTFWPDFAGQAGAVSITFYTSEFPQGPETLRGPFVCVPGKGKVDVRKVEGRLIRMRAEWKASPMQGRLGAPAFYVTNAGER